MSTAQERFYWRLWNEARRAKPGLDRKALHAEHGLPESHLAFGQRDFDAFKGACLAVTNPGDYTAQIAQETMPAIRRRHVAERLAAALGVGAEYLDGIIRRMKRRSSPCVTYATASEGDLWALIVALKLECRRYWPRKPELLAAVRAWAQDNDLDERTARLTVAGALGGGLAPALERLSYDELLTVLAAYRRLGKTEAA